MVEGKVYLVGAGPGDPGLFTRKGTACLAQADLVIYDRLVSPGILDLLPPGTTTYYVGKGSGDHTKSQEEINQLLVQEARRGRVVVRLKGGDPFIFGRGGEEAEFLAAAKIPFEIIPGVTAAAAAPAYAGIPLTHRDYSVGFTVVTGHRRAGKEPLDLDWPRLACPSLTLVILMGMETLPEITCRLIEHGRPPQTPVALIRWGTRVQQETLMGSLEDICQRAGEACFGPPAVAVVGEVVKLRDTLQWFEKKPLFGTKILVTRPREQAGEMLAGISSLGGEGRLFPTITILPPSNYQELDQALEQLSHYDWVVFTSENGVRSFCQRLFETGRDTRSLAGLQLLALGPKTGQVLEEHGLKADCIPTSYCSEAIGEFFAARRPQGILLPRTDAAGPDLVRALQAAGHRVREVLAYRTRLGEEPPPELVQELLDGEYDYITFTSPSTAEGFVRLLGRKKVEAIPHGTKIACIGPVTKGKVEKLGLPVHVTPRQYTVSGLLEALTADRRNGVLAD